MTQNAWQMYSIRLHCLVTEAEAHVYELHATLIITAPAIGGHRAIPWSVRLSYGTAALGYWHAGCLQLSHMWTADLSVDIRRSATSRTAIGGGISSQHPWGDNSCESILTMSLIPKGSLLEQSEEDNSLSTSEVTNLWHYTNLFIIIIIFLNLGRSSRGGRQKLTLEIIALMVNHPSGSHQGLRSRMLTRSSCLSFRLQPAGRCASSLNLRI